MLERGALAGVPGQGAPTSALERAQALQRSGVVGPGRQPVDGLRGKGHEAAALERGAHPLARRTRRRLVLPVDAFYLAGHRAP